ncbi:hypothetical protein CspeluHIS016_0108670 [Cutaneotrichosporon spelunceum]|uniref:Ricin B lectin domain-containing protein n=1 Tax=Cutaneotrichosporon spelunceum TaxID=1672016 RepID=A0AAD3TNT1_9TREE|nr:hypothetical protein CspeluHIS016_0108670 [Cutaneotrichosporon spelunceum]
MLPALVASSLLSTVAAQVVATGPNGPTNPDQPFFLPVGSRVNQASDARLITVNAIDDFCLFAPMNPNSDIGPNEASVVAWCTKPRNNARLIPDGTIRAAQFLRTPSYVQVSGWWDGTKVNIRSGDQGGELDPHGATGEGNPVGGNVTTNVATGNNVFYEEWMSFVSYDQFCVRICTAEVNGVPAAKQCDHIYDLMGCQFVMAIADYWDMQGFESCDSDIAAAPGVYGASTWYQGVNPTPAAPAFLPKRSNCASYNTIANGINMNDPVVTAPPTLVGDGGSQPTPPPTSAPPPTATGGTQFHPKGNSGWCLDVRGGIAANGTPVQVYQCNGSAAQKFEFVRNAAGQVKLAGTNYCLDAGTNPGNGAKLKLWTCYSGLYQQTWWYTGDNHLAIANGPGLCMDVTDGNLSNGNQVQVWACDGPNQNQIWTSNVAGGMRRRRANLA